MTIPSPLKDSPLDSSGGKRRILLAVADARLRAAIKMHLCGDGWQVDLANGNHALHSLARQRPRVLLADLDTADFDPLLLLAAARDIAPWLPVVLCGEAGAIAALDPDLLCGLGVTTTLTLPAKLDAIAARLQDVASRSGAPIPVSIDASVDVRCKDFAEVPPCPNEKLA
jgi:DNA-binding NtrC family response regulator